MSTQGVLIVMIAMAAIAIWGIFLLLGLLYSPFVLFGFLPLFHGARKLAYASMGLAFSDEPHGKPS